jgi:AcrR family transcriptional regulator
VTVRLSAEERREHVIEAAQIEFGLYGFEGTATEAIARRVGVSQPYLFRLFPSKKAIFLATIERCFDRMEQVFSAAASGRAGEEALHAMGLAYNDLLNNREVLQLQLQMWAAACHDEEIRRSARRRMERLFRHIETLTGADPARVTQFVGAGMMLNVFAALEMPRLKAKVG